MNLFEHLMCCLSEEGKEIGIAVSKILRFGVDDDYPGYGQNVDVLVTEFNDLLVVREFLESIGFSIPEDEEKKAAKRAKLSWALNYALEHKQLEPTPELLLLITYGPAHTSGGYVDDKRATDRTDL